MPRLKPKKMTPPTTPLPERAPWALVIGGVPLTRILVDEQSSGQLEKPADAFQELMNENRTKSVAYRWGRMNRLLQGSFVVTDCFESSCHDLAQDMNAEYRETTGVPENWQEHPLWR